MSNPSTLSINAAADLLERDRRTIRRALAMVPPDVNENNIQRWRLRTIVDALDPPRTPDRAQTVLAASRRSGHGC
jgi:hypothetical protein